MAIVMRNPALQIGKWRVTSAYRHQTEDADELRVSRAFFDVLLLLAHNRGKPLSAHEIGLRLGGIKAPSIRRQFKRYAEELEGKIFTLVRRPAPVRYELCGGEYPGAQLKLLGRGRLRRNINSAQRSVHNELRQLEIAIGTGNASRLRSAALVEAANRAVRAIGDPEEAERAKNRLRRLVGTAAMNLALPEATRILRRAMKRAHRLSDWPEFIQAVGNLAAALRMEGPQGVVEAQELCVGTLELLRNPLAQIDLNPIAVWEAQRWLFTTSGKMLIAMGDTLQASDHLQLAQEQANLGGSAQSIETLLRKAELESKSGNVDAADEIVSSLRGNQDLADFEPAGEWTDGWIGRDTVRLLVESGKAIEAVEMAPYAWELNRGFNYQRIALGALYARAMRSIGRPGSHSISSFPGLNRLHQEVVGIPIGRCSCKNGGAAAAFECIETARWGRIGNQLW